MGKIYFTDISRRLLLFALLLVGFVTQAQAITTTSNVIVFREIPYVDNGNLNELKFGATADDVKSLIIAYQRITTESSSSAQFFEDRLDGTNKQF